MGKRKFCMMVVSIIFVLNFYSYAESAVPAIEPAKTPGADLNRILDILRKRRMDREVKAGIENAEKSKKTVDAAPASELPVPETRVTLRSVRFSDSSVLSKKMLDDFSAPFLNREIGMADLKAFVGKINAWYRSKGYITALAVLPRQEIKDGILNVLLIEGKIGKVIIQGNENTRKSFINKRIRVPVGDLLDIRSLDKDLVWFNGTNDLKARIKLQAGEKPGTTDCYILTYEPEDKTCSLLLDTAGNKSTGETRLGFYYSDASISGRRDSMNLTSLMSDSSKAIILGYSRPISNKGSKIAFFHSRNALSVENLGLDIRGRSEMTGLSLTHPVRVNKGFKSELVLEIQHQKSSNSVFNMKFVDDKEVRYAVGQSFLKLMPGQAFYFRPMLTFCSYSGLSEKRKVQKATFDLLWQKIHRGRQQFNLQINGQKAQDDNMPSADQFFLGGLNSVRGYDESILSGDSGLNVKLDYRIPFRGLKRTNAVFFYDWGKIHGKSALPDRMIHSTGWGFIHSFSRDSQISLSVGYPLAKKIGGADVAPQKIELSINTLL